MTPEEEQEEARLPPYWLEIFGGGALVDINLRHVDSMAKRQVVARVELNTETPITWDLVGFEVLDPKFDHGPTSTPWLALWMATIQLAEAHSVLFIRSHLAGQQRADVQTASLQAINEDDVVDLATYRDRLFQNHPHAHRLHFRGKGLESLVIHPRSWRIASARKASI